MSAAGSAAAPGSGARVLLAGGSGLIGAPAARALRAAGHHVTVLSRSRRPVADADEVLVADRSDARALAAALEQRRFDLTVDFLALDAADVERLLLAPRAALGSVVMISSGQVYLTAAGAVPPYPEAARDLPLLPPPPAGTADFAQWSYGAGKRRAELALRRLAASHGVRATALRLPIVMGAADTSLRLWSWLERMLDGGPILLPAGGTQPLRFVWAADVGRALVRLLEGPAPRAFAYNLSQPDTLTLRELLERAARAAGRTPAFVPASWDEIEAAGIAREAFPFAGRWVSRLDPSLVAAELGFAGTPAAAYLPEVVRAHLERPPRESHPGYAERARERELAARIAPGVAARAAP